MKVLEVAQVVLAELFLEVAVRQGEDVLLGLLFSVKVFEKDKVEIISEMNRHRDLAPG